jgi:Tfp pilus assembly protein PilV
LVEVMVAILVLGIALAGLTRGLTTALSSTKESELQTTAALFAAGQIEELRAEGGLTDGTTEGDCGEELELYRWKETVSKTDTDGLHDVTVTIENARSGQMIYELRTLLFEPTEQSTDKAKGGGSGKGGSRG